MTRCDALDLWSVTAMLVVVFLALARVGAAQDETQTPRQNRGDAATRFEYNISGAELRRGFSVALLSHRGLGRAPVEAGGPGCSVRV